MYELKRGLGPRKSLMVRYFSCAAALCLGALVFQTAAAADALSFDEARALFHERSDIFRADAAEVERARLTAESAKWLSGPKIDMMAMHMEGRKELDLDIDVPANLQAMGPMLGAALGVGPISIPSTINVGQELDLGGPRATIQAYWPLYTGGRISAKQNALEQKVREADAAKSERFEMKDAELAGSYWGVQLARSVEKLRSDMLADEEAQLLRAERFEKKGMISKIERMSVEVSRDTARRELASAQTGARVAEAELMSALREKTLPELSTPHFVLTGNLGVLSVWQKKARLNAPLLRKIDAQRNQAEEGVKAAEGNFHPQVFAFGMKNLVKHYLTPVEPDWMAGIGVKFTLFSNSDRMSDIAAARQLVTKAEAARAEADNALMTAVEVAFLQTTQAREEYDLTASTVALAAENLKLRQISFNEGLSTALDVREARTQLIGAQIAQRAAAFKFVVAWVRLHAASGVMPEFMQTLTRADLVPVK